MFTIKTIKNTRTTMLVTKFMMKDRSRSMAGKGTSPNKLKSDANRMIVSKIDNPIKKNRRKFSCLSNTTAASPTHEK
jgi:hypothetical protein